MTLLTETDAQKNWCHQLDIQTAQAGAQITNRAQVTIRGSNASTMCLASGCQAWRWHDAPNGASRRGYCGAAGAPGPGDTVGGAEQLDEKGELLSHDGTDIKTLPVGSNDYVLVGQSSEDVGLLYKDPATVLPNWKVAPDPEPDLYPALDDSMIGRVDNPTRGIVIGRVSGNPDNPGVEGFVSTRDVLGQAGEKGVLVGGYDVTDIGNPPTEPNAPVEIGGTPVLVMGNQLYIQTPQAITGEHYLAALGPSVALPDGRLVVAVGLGPEIQHSHSETATDTRDLLITSGTSGNEENIVSLTLVNTYLVNLSTFLGRVYLSEEGGRATAFEARIYVDDALVHTTEYDLNGNEFYATGVGAILETLNAGQKVDLRVWAQGTHNQARAWVRGSSEQPSEITLRQG